MCSLPRPSRVRRSGRKGGQSRRRELSKDALESLYRSVEARVSLELGLEAYGIGGDMLRDVLEPVVLEIATSLSRPTEDSVVRKIVGNRHAFLKAVAARVLESLDRLDSRRLEFALQHVPELVGRLAPAIYSAYLDVRDDESLSDAIKTLWEAYGRPTVARCPRCGFKALMPDLSCAVCGSSSSEEEFKRSIGLERLLVEWASKSSPDLVREAVAASLVYYEDGELKPPSRPRNPLAIPITLGRREKALLLVRIPPE